MHKMLVQGTGGSMSRPIKIIFLDFDGVLNSAQFKAMRPKVESQALTIDEARDRAIDKAAIARLNVIVERTGAKVVVSSMWRTHISRADLRGLLHRNGFTGVTLDKTPGGSGNRGVQIREWLHSATNAGRVIESFVIIDDEDDFATFGRKRLVHTSYMDGGLLDKHIEHACATLAMPWTPRFDQGVLLNELV